MRTLFLLLSASFFPLAGESAVITGKVKAASGSSIEFAADKPYPQANPKKEIFLLNADFEWKLELERGTLITASAENETLLFFLEPGDELTVTLDPSVKPLNPEFSGKGAGNNRMLNDFNREFSADFNPSNIQAAIEASATIDV
ncbi:MAG TPA: hypothetical protein VNJ07_04325, partial [Chitinophagales bacterium]|nr:hypothetical protein [Chitinophagales bacterium]